MSKQNSNQYNESKLAYEIDKLASKLSGNPVFDNPDKFEKWCETSDFKTK